jgi:hypothetical protein
VPVVRYFLVKEWLRGAAPGTSLVVAAPEAGYVLGRQCFNLAPQL